MSVGVLDNVNGPGVGNTSHLYADHISHTTTKHSVVTLPHRAGAVVTYKEGSQIWVCGRHGVAPRTRLGQAGTRTWGPLLPAAAIS